MPLVAAKCTQCGANIEVDDTKEAGICKYCGTAFITEKAINNYVVNNTYNINNANIIIQSKNIDNLKKLGNDELKRHNYDKAYDYFGEALEIDGDDAECIFKRNIIDQLIDDSDDLAYMYITKILSNYYDDLCTSEYDCEKKNEVIMDASEQCEYVITSYYYKQKATCIVNGKMKTDRYAHFLLASRDTVWAINNLVTYEISLLEQIPELEKNIISQCDFAINVLMDETPKYKDLNNQYGCYTLRGTFADRCYESAEKIAELKNKITPYSLPSELVSPSKGGKGAEQNGCYVATCVYGSYDCPEVWTLRRFRDYTLDTTWYGRLFIKCYYAISPTIVKWFGETKCFKKFWKMRLDKMVSNLNNKGVENTSYTDKY